MSKQIGQEADQGVWGRVSVVRRGGLGKAKPTEAGSDQKGSEELAEAPPRRPGCPGGQKGHWPSCRIGREGACVWAR